MCMKHKLLSQKQKYTHVEIERNIPTAILPQSLPNLPPKGFFSKKKKLTEVNPWKQVIFQDQDLLVNTIRIDDMNRALLIVVILLE